MFFYLGIGAAVGLAGVLALRKLRDRAAGTVFGGLGTEAEMSQGYYVGRGPIGRSIFGGKVYGEGSNPRHDIATANSDPRLVMATQPQPGAMSGYRGYGDDMPPPMVAPSADVAVPIPMAPVAPGGRLPVGPMPAGAQQSDTPTPIAMAPVGSGQPAHRFVRRAPIGRSIFGGPVYGEGSNPRNDIATAASDPRLVSESGRVLNAGPQADTPTPMMMADYAPHAGWRRGREPMDGYRGFGESMVAAPIPPDQIQIPVGSQDRIPRGPGRGVPIRRDFFGRPIGPRGSIAVGIPVGAGGAPAIPVDRRFAAPPIDQSFPPGQVPVAPQHMLPIGRSVFGRPVWNDGPHPPSMVRTPSTNELPTGNTGIFNDAGQDFGQSPDGLGGYGRRGGFG